MAELGENDMPPEMPSIVIVTSAPGVGVGVGVEDAVGGVGPAKGHF